MASSGDPAALGHYCVVDFEEGPLILIPTNWLVPDASKAYWPPWADTIDQVRYDRNVQKRPSPSDDWILENVKRMRAYGDDFPTVRKALKAAEKNSDTDLNESEELPKRKQKKRTFFGDSSSDDEINETQSTNSLSQNLTTPSTQRKSLSSISKTTLPQVTVSKKLEAFKFSTQLSSPGRVAGGSSNTATKEPMILDVSGSVQSKDDNNMTALDPISNSPEDSVDNPVSDGPSGVTIESATSTGSLRGQKSSACSTQQSSAVTSEGSQQPVIVPSSSRTVNTGLVGAASNTQRVQPIYSSEFERIVILNLKSLRATQLEIRNDVTQLKLNFQQELGDHLPRERVQNNSLLGLPADELEGFIEFDEQCKASKKFREEVVVALKQVGGNSLGAVVRGILSRVLSNPVAELFSFKGGKGKKRFDALRFKKILFRTVRGYPAYEDTTDDKIIQIVSTWLANAKTRSNSVKRNGKVPDTPGENTQNEDSSSAEDES